MSLSMYLSIYVCIYLPTYIYFKSKHAKIKINANLLDTEFSFLTIKFAVDSTCKLASLTVVEVSIT